MTEQSDQESGREKLQRPLEYAKTFLSKEEYAALARETAGKVIYRVNTEPIAGTLPFESGTIESNTGDIKLVIEKPLEEEPGLMYVKVNTGATQLLIEDPRIIVKPVFSRQLSISGNPPQNPTRTIYVESNSEKGVEIHYVDSPKREEIKKNVPVKPPQAEYRPKE